MQDFQIFRFTRWGRQLGVLSGLIDERRVEEVNGEDSLTLTCTDKVAKGDYLVACDRAGRWHEWRVTGVKLSRSSGVPAFDVTAEASIQETIGDYIEDKRPGVQSPTTCDACLDAALEPTRWERGEVAVSGTGGVSMYHTNALAAMRRVAEAFGGELRPTIEVSGSRVSARKVDVLARVGRERTGKRFEYRKDLTDVRRIVQEDEVYTAMWAWGGGGDNGEHKLGIAEVNGGKGYVEDPDALAVWGLPDGNGGKRHVFGVYENPDRKAENPGDAEALKAEAEEDLREHSQPKVAYELSAVDLSAYGYDWEGTELGDGVDIVDDELGVEATGRVLKIAWDDLDPTGTEVTIGNVRGGIEGVLADQAANWQQVQGSMDAWNQAASASKPYLDLLRQGLNAVFAESGSYVYQSPEIGYVTSSVPLDDAMRPTSTPFYAVQMARGMLRLSTEVDGSGDIVWGTWVTGGGMVADVINAGTIRGGANSWNLETGDMLFEQGIIRSADGRNFWNLTNGELSFQGVPSSEQTVSGVDVEYALGPSQTQAPSSGWSTTAPAWQEGRYMWQRTKVTTADGTVSYSDPTCIQGAQGPRGEQGVPGPAGADGESNYFHVKYAPNGSPSASQMTETPQAYIGTYVDGVPQDSADPSDYQWVKIEGTDGAQGTPGTDGQDGVTYYLHIAYADSADGTKGFSVSDSSGKLYLGQCVNTSQPDPTTPSSYSWSLIKGDDGTGVSAVVEQYYLSTSSATQSGGSWSTAQPTWQKGRYIWTRSVVTWTDGTTTYTAPVLAQAINGANQAAQGAQDAVDALDQQAIFDLLTDNGRVQGVFMRDGDLFVNGSHIEADWIEGDTVVAKRLGNEEGHYAEIGTVRTNAGSGDGMTVTSDGTEVMTLSSAEDGEGGNNAIIQVRTSAGMRLVFWSRKSAACLSTGGTANEASSRINLNTSGHFLEASARDSTGNRYSMWLDSAGLHGQRSDASGGTKNFELPWS